MVISDVEHGMLDAMNSQICTIYEFLADQKYEIDFHMTDFDSLHFLAESIKKYDLKLESTQTTGDSRHW